METIDISKLPNIAKIEIIDFYQFLAKKYEYKMHKKVDKKSFIPRKVDSFTPMKREEIYER